MSLIDLILVLVVLGLILYLVNILPIDQTIKNIIHVLVVVVVILWLLSLFVGPLRSIRIGSDEPLPVSVAHERGPNIDLRPQRL